MSIDPNVPALAFRGGADQPSPMQTLAQMMQMQQMQQHGQMQQQESAMRQEEFGLRRQQFEAERAAEQRAQEQERGLNELLAQATPRLEDGSPDLETLRQTAAAKKLGAAWPKIEEHVLKAETTRLTWREKQQSAQAALADRMGYLGLAIRELDPEDRPAAFLMQLGDFVKDGVVPPERALQMKVKIIENPGAADEIIATAIRNAPTLQAEERKRREDAKKLHVVGDALYRDPMTPGGAPTFYRAPEKPASDFTLSPGQRRFAGTTNIQTASVPLTPAQQHVGGAESAGLDPTIAAKNPAAALWASTALASVRGKEQKAGWVQNLNASWASGEEDFKRALKNTAIENLNVQAKDVINARGEAVRAMTAFQGMLEHVPTGYLKGTAEKTYQALGQSGDPALAKLGVEMRAAYFAWRHGQTGGQFSLPEDQSYGVVWPAMDVSKELNLARIDGMLGSMRRIDREFWQRRFGSQGADYLGATDPDAPGLQSGQDKGPPITPGLTPGAASLGRGAPGGAGIKSITPIP